MKYFIFLSFEIFYQNQQMGVITTAQNTISLHGVIQGRTSKYTKMLSLGSESFNVSGETGGIS